MFGFNSHVTFELWKFNKNLENELGKLKKNAHLKRGGAGGGSLRPNHLLWPSCLWVIPMTSYKNLIVFYFIYRIPNIKIFFWFFWFICVKLIPGVFQNQGMCWNTMVWPAPFSFDFASSSVSHTSCWAA